MIPSDQMCRCQIKLDGQWREVTDIGALEPDDVIRFLSQDGELKGAAEYVVARTPMIQVKEASK